MVTMPNRSTVNQWVIKFRDCEPENAMTVDENTTDVRSSP